MRPNRPWILAPLFTGLLIFSAATICGPLSAAEFPEEFTLEYPAISRVVPPVRSTFYEVTRSVETVNGHTFRHPLNGGFGVKLGTRIGNQEVVHLGADLGWFRVDEPVFAVAEGIVRASRPPLLEKKKGEDADDKPPSLPAGAMLWGNLIVIEHQLESGAHVTTLYGHLGKRLVKPGDVVKAGQQIGTIGKQSVTVNGGYKPHLHFGVRPGRAFEVGTTLSKLLHGDTIVPITIKALDPKQVELDFGPAATRAATFHLNVGGSVYHVKERDGRFYIPASLLWSFQSPSFPIIGYAPTTDGWADPIAFLRNPDIIRPVIVEPEQPVKIKALQLVGEPAPRWSIPVWHGLPEGKESLDVGDFGETLVAVLCFQSDLVDVSNRGLAAYRKLVDRYKNDAGVAFTAIQAPLPMQQASSFARAKRLLKKHRLDIPLGHESSQPEDGTIISAYGIIGTPWLLLIDREGTLRFNGYMPDDEKAADLIERVKALQNGRAVESDR